MKNNDFSLFLLVITTGVASVVSQLVMVREFLSRFSGNEYVIAMVLFLWLFSGGVGTLLSKQVRIFREHPSEMLLCTLSFILASLPVFQVFFIRCLSDSFFLPGTSVGFYGILLFAVSVIFPYGVLLGFVLPYSLFLIRKNRPEYSPTGIYITDNIGDALGGIFFSFFLVSTVSTLQSLVISAVILCGASFVYGYFHQVPMRRLLFFSVAAGSVAIAGIGWEMSSLQPEEGELSFYKESKYGRVAIYKDKEQVTFVADGVPLFSNQDQTLAEEIVHYPLSQLETPKKILVISGQGRIFKELEKYNLETVFYIEMDREVSDALFNFKFMEKIDGLTIISDDGRRWLKKTRHTFDAIIVNMPEPETFQTNRFFTTEFFDLAGKRLKNGGVLSFYMEGFDNYLTDANREKLSSVYQTLSQSFHHIAVFPGQPVFFLSSENKIETDIPARLSEKGIPTQYFDNYFYGNVTPIRMDYLKDLLQEEAPLNSDLSPNLMKIMFATWFEKYQTSPYVFFSVLGAVILLYLYRMSGGEFVLFSTGISSMGSEIGIIFIFQAFFGYVYFQIGMIVTVFLIGLFPGAWVGEKLVRKDKKHYLMSAEIALILVFLVFFVLLHLLGASLPPLFFLLTGFIVSFLCGIEFPLASLLSSPKNSVVAKAFSADLMGASLGIVIVSLFIIPYWGINGAGTFLILLKVFSLYVLSAMSKQREEP